MINYGIQADPNAAAHLQWANSINQWAAENATRENTRTAGLVEADATAEEESAKEMANANRATASRTGALALQLATARRSPGGGIRQGIRRKGFSAASAGYGLNRANAEVMLGKKKATRRAQVESRYAQTGTRAMPMYSGPTLWSFAGSS